MASTSRCSDTLIVRQNVRILVHEGEHGPIIRELHIHNLVVDSGLDHIRDLLAYPDDDIPERGVNPQYVAVGIGTTAVVAGDTTLVTEVYRGELSYRDPETNGIVFGYYLSTSEANDNDLTEAGLYSAYSGGTLWSRSVYAPIEKSPSVGVTYQWTWTIGNA